MVQRFAGKRQVMIFPLKNLSLSSELARIALFPHALISVFFQIEGQRVDEGKWRLFQSKNGDRKGNGTTFFCVN